MSVEKKQLGTQFTRALIDVQSINVENRTVDVVFATETPVMRRNWDIGLYNEVLVCDPKNVRMERMNAGAPLLDAHSRWSVTTQLGVVEGAAFEKKEGRATIRFSKREDAEKVWQDVQDKIVRGISVGYNVYAYEVTEKADNSIPLYRAIDWEPVEISLVPVPADVNSGVRAQDQKDLHEVIINNSKNKNSHTMTRAEEIMAATRAANLPETFGQRLIDDAGITIEAARAAIATEAAKPSNPAPAAPAAPAVDARAAQQIANKRSTDILHAVRSAGFDLAFAETLINDENMTVDGARAAIITKLGEKQPATRSAAPAAVIIGAEETDKIRSAMSSAILVRAMPAFAKAEDIKVASDFRGMDLMDMARSSVERAGMSTTGLTKREIANLSLNIGERQMSTSDFPNILGNTINRTLRAAYEAAPQSFRPWTVKKTANDFRDMASVTLNDLGSLSKVVEGGEYKQSTIGEGAEKYRVAKYGTIINITWETLINDDLGAFSRIPQKLATAAANTQSDIIYAILSANAAMADGTALFHANHGNLAGAGTAISIASLAAAKAAMRKQRAPGVSASKPGAYLNLTPKYLIVGPDKENEALQFTSAMYQATTGAAINPLAGTLEVLVDPRISGNQWYLAADPSQIDTIEYAFLDGEELYTEQRTGFEVDGMQTKVRTVFGAKAIDYRGLYSNTGA